MQNKFTELLTGKRELLVLLAVVLLAFGLRCFFLMDYRYPLMLHEQDGIAYMQIAHDLLHFKPLQTVFMPPFYPVVIALFSLLPVDFELAARLASVTMDALIVLPLYDLVKKLFNKYVSFCVCILWACFSVSLYSSLSPMAFSTYLFFILTGTSLLYRVLYEDQHVLWLIASGACFAFAYLTRPEGITGFAIGLIFCVVCSLRKEGINRKSVKCIALYLAGFVLFAAPYWIFLHNHLGYWTFTGKTAVAIQGVDGSLILKGGVVGGKGAGGLSLWLDKFGGLTGAVKFVLNNAGGFLTTLRSQFPAWMGVCALIGFCFLWVGREFRSRLILLIPVLVTAPVYIANLPKTPGYIYPLFPVFFIAFSWCLDRIVFFLKKAAEKCAVIITPVGYQVASGICALVVLSFIGYDSFTKVAAIFESQEFLYQVELTIKIFKESGEFVKTVSKPTDLVMTRWGLISYNAERPYAALPKGNVAEVIEYGRKAGVRFLVIDTISVESRRQELVELLDPLYGKGIDPHYGIMAMRANGYYDLGGYVVYRYIP